MSHRNVPTGASAIKALDLGENYYRIINVDI